MWLVLFPWKHYEGITKEYVCRAVSCWWQEVCSIGWYCFQRLSSCLSLKQPILSLSFSIRAHAEGVEPGSKRWVVCPDPILQGTMLRVSNQAQDDGVVCSGPILQGTMLRVSSQAQEDGVVCPGPILQETMLRVWKQAQKEGVVCAGPILQGTMKQETAPSPDCQGQRWPQSGSVSHCSHGLSQSLQTSQYTSAPEI